MVVFNNNSMTRSVEMMESLSMESSWRRWNYVFIFANTTLLILAISLICLMVSLESYWDFFYPFLQVYKEMNGMGVFFTASAITLCTIYGYILICIRKGKHYIWYGLSLLLVIILDSRIIISGLVNESVVRSFVERSFTTGMKYYTNNTIYKRGVDNVQLALMCCGSRNYTDWYKIPGGFIPYSCCPFSGPPNMVNGTCVNIEGHVFTQGCYDSLVDVPQVGMALIYCIVSIVISIKVLTMILTYKLEQMYKEL